MRRIKPLLKEVLDNGSDEAIWDSVYKAVIVTTPSISSALPAQMLMKQNSSSIVNSSEFRQHMDMILKNELEYVYVDVPGLEKMPFGVVVGLEAAAQAIFKSARKGMIHFTAN